MAQEVFMDVPAVKSAGKRFDDMADMLRKASQMLETTIMALKASAFVGLVGNHAVASYLETLKPQIDNYAAHCVQMAGDLIKSAEAFERGDAQGATRFH
jgi:hypothetical protein